MRQRRAILVEGVVQGVGFRPFVHGLASRLELAGFVRNRAGTVLIEVEGREAALERFVAELSAQSLPLARIERLSWQAALPRGDSAFRIEPSEGGKEGTFAPPSLRGAVFISPDVAPCDDCVRELHDPRERRWHYPFLNCTNCGPRLTIITGAPYDRARTTMAPFAMCAACRAEYDDPRDRRFHAQATACPQCGPQLALLGARGAPIEVGDPLRAFAAAVLHGRIGALKGLGGYHLVCDARREEAVAELRRRKHRDEKPFAVMVPDLDAAESLCKVGAAERELLMSPRRPIVLLRQRAGGEELRRALSPHPERPPQGGRELGAATPHPERPPQGGREFVGGADIAVCPAVAPGNPYLGVMLPYTPLHHLLMGVVGGVPLVMTSGNRSDEPIAYEDDDAIERLAGIADVFLVHNRRIHVRCEDSVTRIVAGGKVPVRRSRGYAPEPIALPLECPVAILAVGGQLKGTFALGRGHHAFVSHYVGDLDDYQAYRAFVKDVRLYEELFGIEPRVIAHDLHPDYASTAYALERAGRADEARCAGLTCAPGPSPPSPLSGGERREKHGRETARLVAVQHHHAHVASCMAEHLLDEPVIGVAFDGTGFGSDGAVWGGEFLVADYSEFRRLARLRYVGMPGGEQAIREPWRMAAAHLLDAGVPNAPLGSRISPEQWRGVERMLERRLNAPMTSSMGRLFDAVASLVGLRDRVSYEGQAAVELEWAATDLPSSDGYPFELLEPGSGRASDSAVPIVIDTRPLIRAVAEDTRRGVEPAVVARRYHSTVVEIIAAVCGKLRQRTGLTAVVLSGGVFLNALLTSETCERLKREGFHVYRHRLVPPNDGGLSLGQLAIAGARTRNSNLDCRPLIPDARLLIPDP